MKTIADVKTFEDWKEVTGTRFRLTKDEKDRKISREQALAERVDEYVRLGGSPTPKAPQKASSRISTSRHPGITIRLRPEAGVNPEYLEGLPSNLEITLDDKWFGWLETRLEHPYGGDLNKLLKHVLDLGIGEVATNIHNEEDFGDYEN